MANDPRDIRRLAAIGYNPKKQFNNPLAGAAMFGAPAALKALLSYGVNPAMYPDGSVPLLAAVEHDHQAAVRQLFRAGARPNPTLKGGASPLDYAMPCRDQTLVNLLLDHGVKPSPRSAALAKKFGLTLHSARKL